jgi:hypothetical protein
MELIREYIREYEIFLEVYEMEKSQERIEVVQELNYNNFYFLLHVCNSQQNSTKDLEIPYDST